MWSNNDLWCPWVTFKGGCSITDMWPSLFTYCTGEIFDYLLANGRMKERDVRIKFRQVRFHLSAVDCPVLNNYNCICLSLLTTVPTVYNKYKLMSIPSDSLSQVWTVWNAIIVFTRATRSIVRYMLRQRHWLGGWVSVRHAPVLFQNG